MMLVNSRSLLRKISLVTILTIVSNSALADRIKDIADVAGVRSNQLVGYGLVAGLSGSGDGKDLRRTK